MAVPAAVLTWRSTQQHLKDHADGTTGSVEVVSVAFLGRTSTYDRQDPTLSLPRQMHACQAALPTNARLVAFFYDIESGRMPLSERGHGSAHEQMSVPVPRDGGVRELLTEAARADRRFSVVICEDIGRAGRRAVVSTEIEHRLELCGVRLIAADEPFHLGGMTWKATSATEVLTRRLKQGIAEWYVMEMLEKSWGGFEIHAEQGFNVGKPCYGYRAEQVAHPVPAKREKGLKKTRLVVDPVEGAVVRRVFEWRIVERLSYQSIADRLNTDLASNPAPVPVDPKRAVGKWTGSSIREVLTNPKHTGYMVWNRRSSKAKPHSKTNPIEAWVWSPEPVHEALVSLEAFLLAQDVARHTQGSGAVAVTRADGDLKREYLLRGFVFCAQCGRRMFGNQRGNHRYYACSPKQSQRPEGHPVAIRVREDHLIEAAHTAIATNAFGTYARKLQHYSREAAAGHDHQHERLAELRTRRERLARALDIAEHLDEGLVDIITAQADELRNEQQQLEAELTVAQVNTDQDESEDASLLVPVTASDLNLLPPALARRLYKAVRLSLHYNHIANQVLCCITLVSTAPTSPPGKHKRTA